MEYHIYAYENRTNGKIYIGQTSDLKKRDYQHSNKHNSSLLTKAIKKYGRGNFDLWTICIVDTSEQANQEEIYWIGNMRYHLGKNMVYNITDGGESGRRGLKFSKESLHKIFLGSQKKLTDDEVSTLISVYKEGRVKVKDLSRIYGIDKRSIYDLVRGLTYKHVR